MLYLAIDQHAKQLTVNARNELGTVVLRRQVFTHPEKVREFFAAFRQQAASEGGYLTILEVCGFNDWLLALLSEFGWVEPGLNHLLNDNLIRTARCSRGDRSKLDPCRESPRERASTTRHGTHEGMY